MESKINKYLKCALNIQEAYIKNPCKETALKALYALRTAGIKVITAYNIKCDKSRILERMHRKADKGIYMLDPFKRDVEKIPKINFKYRLPDV